MDFQPRFSPGLRVDLESAESTRDRVEFCKMATLLRERLARMTPRSDNPHVERKMQYRFGFIKTVIPAYVRTGQCSPQTRNRLTSLKSKWHFITCHPDNERVIVHTEWDEPRLFPADSVAP